MIVLIEHESERKADFRLGRLCQWAGEDLTKFERVTIGSAPPVFAPGTVAVSLGIPATVALIGARGYDLVRSVRGYVEQGDGFYVVPTLHPRFIEAGNAKYSAAFINDLQKACQLARGGLPTAFTEYSLDSSPLEAFRWAQQYRAHLSDHPGTYCAFDIETPGKGDDEDDLDTDEEAPDRTWNIERIGFSYQAGHALSVPFSPEYQAAIRLILSSPGPKVVWNAGFDVPRLRRAGCNILGTIHDGMVAWHILHSDLPKRLGFVATFTCPWQPAWKHLSGLQPAFYNAVDADVELRSMVAIESELRKTGLWEVYQRDVVELEPLLQHMQLRGMPIDANVRLERATRLEEARVGTLNELEALFPQETRRIEHVYKNTPVDKTGLQVRRGTRDVPVCPACGLERPRKDHFKVFKRKLNPCGGYVPVRRTVKVDEYYRLSEFTPSRDQLIRYHQHVKRPVPTVWDPRKRERKVSFGVKQIKELTLRYPDDRIYPLILTYRKIDKIAGTYIGRPCE